MMVIDKEKIVVGLEVGTAKICVVVGRKNEDGKLEIISVGKAVSDGVIIGKVININKTTIAISKAVEMAEKANVKINEVFVGIAQSAYKEFCS